MLHLVQLTIPMRALYDWANLQDLLADLDDELHGADQDYLLHTLMSRSLGDAAPQPFMTQTRGAEIIVYGYTRTDVEAMRARARLLAEPAALTALQPDLFRGHALPEEIPAGTRIGFRLRCCPVRRNRKTGEQDCHLAARRAGHKLSAEQAYVGWLAERLHGAAELVDAHLAGLSHPRVTRRDGTRRLKPLRRPAATIQGTLTVRDPDAFRSLLSGGIGRHKAFGFGFMLLQAARS